MIDLSQGERCVLLAIDPGKKSGGAVFVNGQLACSAFCKTAHERREVVSIAVATAIERKLPLMVVREKWTAGGKKMGPATYAGMGAAWGAWREWLLYDGVLPSRILSVYPQTWASAVLGNNRGIEEKAMAYVNARWGRQLEPDEAVAVCIGVWALGSTELHGAIPKRAVKPLERLDTADV